MSSNDGIIRGLANSILGYVVFVVTGVLMAMLIAAGVIFGGLWALVHFTAPDTAAGERRAGTVGSFEISSSAGPTTGAINDFPVPGSIEGEIGRSPQDAMVFEIGTQETVASAVAFYDEAFANNDKIRLVSEQGVVDKEHSYVLDAFDGHLEVRIIKSWPRQDGSQSIIVMARSDDLKLWKGQRP